MRIAWLILFAVTGILCAVTGAMTFADVFTSRSSLVAIRGRLADAQAQVRSYTSRGNTTRRAELVFHLQHDRHEFGLTREVAANEDDSSERAMMSALQKAPAVTARVRAHDTDGPAPKIFQLEADDSVLLRLDEVRSEPLLSAVIFTFIGVVLITVSILAFRRSASL